jgi:hypothetical protein
VPALFRLHNVRLDVYSWGRRKEQGQHGKRRCKYERSICPSVKDSLTFALASTMCVFIPAGRITKLCARPPVVPHPESLAQVEVVITRAFFLFSPCNHIINIYKKIFFRRSKRQRNFCLLFFASPCTPPFAHPSAHPSATSPN